MDESITSRQIATLIFEWFTDIDNLITCLLPKIFPHNIITVLRYFVLLYLYSIVKKIQKYFVLHTLTIYRGAANGITVSPGQ